MSTGECLRTFKWVVESRDILPWLKGVAKEISNVILSNFWPSPTTFDTLTTFLSI